MRFQSVEMEFEPARKKYMVADFKSLKGMAWIMQRKDSA